MLCEPDVRWEGVSHKQIVAWTRDGLGAAVTERLEARLAGATDALYDNSDQVNATLQRVNGGEWTGGAATAAAAAMRVMRDFDDIMGHHGKVNGLAAYGQSDNAVWAKANVPPYVEPRAAQVPTGTPLDAVNATADHQHQAQAAREAEERARQVMRDYHTMTTSRIAALPPLSPAPQLVVTAGDSSTEPSGGGPGGGDAAPRGSRPEGGPAEPKPGPGSTPREPPGRTGAPVTPPGGTPGPTGFPAPVPPPGGGAQAGEPTRAAAASSGLGRQPGPDAPRDHGQPGGGPRDALSGGVLRDARPGPLGARPATPATGRVVTEPPGRAVRGGGPFGVAPGTASRTDEDREHRDRYAVPGSEIFEPDNDDGMLHDPYRPGSYVAPASIGDDDE